ncbi:7-cyano-7-deazaguanine synthase [Fundidesulfovibrio magnetotacticus]|uniref:7-cyano-7-deazaguanine synthase n=1 Tax=Fundidesulfovibrio magnetotacticus TaxID=2730080 RepID=A0A6V8LQB0_9BACT|nr:7-cyano-7-deazaguanine synthase QueC [Fundidesulfovibrio magnetotacticus]GFK93160.1 7-cyano-7-deazaguanine synthase [Fundidesulfovibrio magnetotacticus]
MKNAIVLFSGGLDSSTCLAIAKAQGFRAYALSFRYGQRHEVELEAARRVAAHLGAAGHLVLDVPLGTIGGSALTADIDVPKDRDVSHMDEGIPVTYVPARNTVFLSLALAWAEVLPSADLFIGVNALDYSGYPDCRPEFVAAFEAMANLATREAVEGRLKISVHAPLMRWHKSRIIEEGMKLGVDYGLTHSCYDPTPQGLACGRCDSCLLRKKGFEEAGVKDPTRYSE